MPIIGSILLNCSSGSSNKDYKLEIERDDDLGGARTIIARYGPKGKLTQLKNYGAFTSFKLQKMIVEKQRKGYEIVSVNGRPYPRADVEEAIRLMVGDTSWSETQTAQPNPQIKPVEVTVTFEAGQIAPVW
jgi:hypothetical protein